MVVVREHEIASPAPPPALGSWLATVVGAWVAPVALLAVLVAAGS